MDYADTANRALQKLQRLDDIYRNSPSAQVLVANAPQILQSFKEMNMLSMQYKMELDALAINRAYDLEKFKLIAPKYLDYCNQLLKNTLELQKTVREHSHRFATDSNVATVINYTNRQIQDNIKLFQSITFALLNA